MADFTAISMVAFGDTHLSDFFSGALDRDLHCSAKEGSCQGIAFLQKTSAIDALQNVLLLPARSFAMEAEKRAKKSNF